MATYVVEAFLSRERAAELETLTARLPDAGPVRHVASYFIPEDETTLHVVEGASADAIRQALQRVGLTADRIVLADPIDVIPRGRRGT